MRSAFRPHIATDESDDDHDWVVIDDDPDDDENLPEDVGADGVPGDAA